MSIFFLIILIIWIWIGNCFYNNIFNKKKIHVKNIEGLERETYMSAIRKSDSAFQSLKKETSMQEVYIISKDKIKLHAYYFPSRSHKWVLLVHDYLKDAVSMSILGKYYHNRGYHVLQIDLRGHGKSGGVSITMGKWEKIDILSWISYIQERDSEANIVLHGITLGAFAILMSLEYHFSKQVKVVVSDSTYTSIYDILYYECHIRFGILTYPILLAGSIITKLRIGLSLKDTSLFTILKRNKKPILFIYSKEDDWIPPVMSKALYKETTALKEKCEMKGNHGILFLENEQTYQNALSSFLSKYDL